MNKEENQLSEDKRKVAKRPPLRKGMDKSAAAETKGEDWAIQEAAEKLIKEQPKKDVGADENLNEDDTDSDTLDARKQIKTPNTADETDDAENDV